MNNESRIGSTLVPHYVISPTLDVVAFNGRFFVWHNGRSIACYTTDTEAIAYADSLHVESVESDDTIAPMPTVSRTVATSNVERIYSFLRSSGVRVAIQRNGDESILIVQPDEVETLDYAIHQYNS